MNVPLPTPKVTPLIAIVAIGLMASAYFLFLYASWHQFQSDRAMRDTKIDELLDRLPKPKEAPSGD